MKKYLSTILALFFCINNVAIAQISTKQAPRSFHNKSITDVIATTEMPSINLTQLLAKDQLEEGKDIPQRFGKDIDVNLSLSNSGTWTTLSNGGRIWRLKINSTGAYSINLIYNEFFIPEGATFHLYNSSKTYVIGGFTSINNKSNRKFATGLVKGESCILEYFEPINQTGNGIINVSKVIHAYKNILGFGSSGSCNNNVNCTVGNNWQDEKRSVAMVLLRNNTRGCSGALVNNVNEDTTPFFLTADHCSGGGNIGDIENWIFMFNYESPNCINIDGMTDQTISGCIVRAKNADSDFLLVELSSKPPKSYNAYYAGWTRVNTPSTNSVGIHHPRGDIKKISFDYNPTLSSDYDPAPYLANSHWKIQAWDDGTTEPISSGSPLFDQNSRIIGQLHGGTASCTSITSDFYGKFSMSWNIGLSSSSRLRDWLYPNNTGVTVLDGTYGNTCASNLVITQNIASGNTDTKSASISITASNVIKSGATAIYKAGQSITLRPGFHAKSGSSFTASIESCGQSQTRAKSNKTVLSNNQEKIKTIEPNKNKFLVYPNPSKGQFTISYNFKINNKYKIYVYNSLGNIIKVENINLEKPVINLYPIINGIYYIRLLSNNIEVENTKLLIKQ